MKAVKEGDVPNSDAQRPAQVDREAGPETVPSDSSPVLVFGAKHSGTTILYKMLAYHPGLTWFSQFSLRGGEIPGRRRIPGVSGLDVVFRSIIHEWHKEESRFERPFVPRPVEAPTIWDFLLRDDTADPARVRSCLGTFSERFGRRPVLAKLPDFVRFLDLLRDAFPRAHFVHIIRDGRALALSLRSQFEVELNHREALHAAARLWIDVLEQTASTPGIDLFEVRYEDLCEDVHGAIRAILDHAGLDADAFPYRRCPPTLAQRNVRWLEGATTEELAEVSEIQRDLLIRYGYPLVLPAARSAA
jgi:omega-hydroxy-beta-dihydromenaquinone-9 sulfotransferase